MSKPTLFFSHSSKDKDMILAIKNKVMKYTSGTLEIFQSSDGESIPFGTNWIHKVEEGLKDSKVMFVFVTENSISSGWIYFEAGYAYSKGIHVIPVGIGVSVGELKAPLNLLQGFNITSADSLNNILTIINREFEYNFSAQFIADDYNEIVGHLSSSEKINMDFEQIISSIRFCLEAECVDKSSKEALTDTEKTFNRIKTYLDEHEIEYSMTKCFGYGSGRGSSILVRGIKFIYELPSEKNDFERIHVSISPFNFEKTFMLYNEIVANCFENSNAWIQLGLNDRYVFVTADEDCAAFLLESPEWFSLTKSRAGSFDCNKLGVHFGVKNNGTNLIPDYVLGIGYEPTKIKAENIVSLIFKLRELGIIYSKSGGTTNA